jgi:hypothetical protein
MPMQQFSNSKDTMDAIAARLRSSHRPFAGAQFRLASVESPDGPLFLTGTAVFAESELASLAVAAYRSLHLLETWIGGQDAAMDSIARILLGRETLQGHKISNTFGHSILQHSAEGELASGWPCWVFASSVDFAADRQRLFLPPEPTVSKGLEPFCSPADAVRSWIFNSPGSINSIGEIPNQERFLTVVPDTRACFESGKWEPGRLTLQVSLNIAPRELELQVIHVGALKRSAIHPVVEGPVTIDVPEDAQQLILHLVHQNSDLICHKPLYAAYRSFGYSEQEVEQEDFAGDLSNGENESRGFKPFIAPNHEKQSELVRSVVAFANTAGGRLFIGVSDEGTPLGLPAAQRIFRQSDSPVEAQLAWVRKLIADNTKPVPNVAYRVVMIRGNPVIVAEVSKLSRICSTRENLIYIRKGATNRLADPLTEIPSMLSPQNWIEGQSY